MAAAVYHLTKAIRPAEDPLVFTRKTRHFTLIVTEVEPEHEETEWDNATVDQRLKAVLDEKNAFRRLEIRLECGGRLVGQTHARFALRHPESPVRTWFERRWLREVISEARAEIELMMKSFSGIRLVA